MDWEILQIPEFKECEFIQITDILCDSYMEAINLVVNTKYDEPHLSSIVELYRYNRSKKKEKQSGDCQAIRVFVCGLYDKNNKISEDLIISSIKNTIGQNVTIYTTRTDLESTDSYINYVKQISASDIVVVILKDDYTKSDSTSYEVSIAKIFEKTILYIDVDEFLNKKGE